MSDCKSITNESQTSNGKWILRRIVVAGGMSSVGPLEERQWELIDGLTGVVRRTYKGVEYDGRYCIRCDGPVSVEFSDDQEWLIVQEELGGHYKERLPDTGSDEERTLAELLLAPEVPSDEAAIPRLVQLLAEPDVSYPPGCRRRLHERAIEKLTRIGSGAIPALLAALENETQPADSVAVTLPSIGRIKEELFTRIIHLATNRTLRRRLATNTALRRRFAALLGAMGQRKNLQSILIALLRHAGPPLQVSIAHDLGLDPFPESGLTNIIVQLALRRPAQAVALLEAVMQATSAGSSRAGLAMLVSDALSDEAAGTRRLACLALHQIGPEAAHVVPHVQGLLNDSDPIVRRLAQNAVRSIQGGSSTDTGGI